MYKVLENNYASVQLLMSIYFMLTLIHCGAVFMNFDFDFRPSHNGPPRNSYVRTGHMSLFILF